MRALAPLRPYAGRMALSTTLGTLTLLASAGLLATSGYLITRAAQQPEILSLIVAITAVRGFALVRALARYGERLVSHDVALRALAAQRGRFFAGLSRLGPADLPEVGRADLLQRFVGDVDTLQDLYLRALAPPLVALFAGAATVVAAALLLPAGGALLAAGLLLAATAVPALAARVAARSGRRQAPARAELTAALVEGLAGAEELAVAGREAAMLARVREASDTLVAIQRRDAWAGGLATALGGVLAGTTTAAVTAVAVAAVEDGRLEGVGLAALVLLALVAFDGVTPLALAARTLRGCLGANRRLEQVAAIIPSVQDPPDPLAAPDTGALAARDITVRLGDSNVLDGLDLALTPGRSVALVGPSGSGKSTLAALLVRFRDPERGRVTLGGVDVRELEQAELRRHVRLAGQDAHLFAASIRANLLLAQPQASDAELVEALTTVGLGPWLAELPRGLDTLVGEHGAAVSGGQRQRIAAARVVLARPRFALFDEPAAHLDQAGAAALHAALAGLTRAGTGVLVITHAAEGLEPFDAVVRLEGSSRPRS